MSETAKSPSNSTSEPLHPDWRAEYASTAGVQAFIYGFPYIFYGQLRHAWVTIERVWRLFLRGGQPFLARRAPARRLVS